MVIEPCTRLPRFSARIVYYTHAPTYLPQWLLEKVAVMFGSEKMKRCRSDRRVDTAYAAKKIQAAEHDARLAARTQDKDKAATSSINTAPSKKKNDAAAAHARKLGAGIAAVLLLLAEDTSGSTDAALPPLLEAAKNALGAVGAALLQLSAPVGAHAKGTKHRRGSTCS